MLHTQLHGTHWQIGFQLGAGLARDGHFILDAVPFPITPARLEFARTCLPLCRRWFPAALEELRGLAQGQGCAPDELAGVLFSMYAMPPGPCCSCFALRRGRGALFGRNSDFLTELEEHNANCLYRFSDGGYSLWATPPPSSRWRTASISSDWRRDSPRCPQPTPAPG